MNRYTMHELDGKKMSVRDFLNEYAKMPSLKIADKELIKDISLDELSKKYIDRQGHFYLHKEDYDVANGKTYYHYILFYFVDKGKL